MQEKEKKSLQNRNGWINIGVMGTTTIWHVAPDNPDPAALAAAAHALKNGELVAFPTETVYGLGANALDEAAVARIFTAKGRPQDNPLIVHFASPDQLPELARDIPPVAYQLAQAHWPGPLTLILPKSDRIPDRVTAGLPNVALRIPSHPVALALIRTTGLPLAAPSANTSGRPSPTTAAHVHEDLGDRIAAILNGGPVAIGVESTVLDLTTPIPTLLRPGGVSLEQLRAEIGPVALHQPCADGEEVIAQSPGMKYRHYAPEAPYILVEGPKEKVREYLTTRIESELKAGKRIGLLAMEKGDWPSGVDLKVIGPEAEKAARLIYQSFREFNQVPVDLILGEGMGTAGMGLAVMNRLRKAAQEIVEIS